MRRIKNRDEILKFMEEEHQQHFKVALLLAGAHGAGLATCATVWKDYASTPQYQGIGVLFIILGTGLISAIINYAIVFIARNIVRGALMIHEDPNDAWGAVILQIFYWVTVVVSAGALLAAIGFLVWRSRLL